MKFRPRLLPAVILAASALLGVKIMDLASGGMTEVARAQASGPAQPATGTPVDLTKLANQSTAASPATPPPGAPSGTPQAASAPAPAADAADAAGNAAAPTLAKDPIKDPLLLSPSEIQELQQLSDRRATLDRRAGEIEQQNVVLQAAEKRIDDKIATLQDLQKKIDDAVAKQTTTDDARLDSLVKIYQAMKPADAAQILGQLDMPVLLSVVSRMKEAKTAPILAAMDTAKAKAITTALADRPQPAGATGTP